MPTRLQVLVSMPVHASYHYDEQPRQVNDIDTKELRPVLPSDVGYWGISVGCTASTHTWQPELTSL